MTFDTQKAPAFVDHQTEESPFDFGAWTTDFSAPAKLATRQVGFVTLVGAGPGDADLLTVRAVRAIAEAEVVLTDYLVGEDVLRLARADAEIISVGKAKGRHSKTQAEINALIVHHARRGLNVVRLKGGDPFMFGRGGEEIDCLRASGIRCEVVPGITAAAAAAASLQIPLTHRDFARTVTFLSGHAPGDTAPDFGGLDFKALKAGGSTLAVYMGVSTAHLLGAHLIAEGWSEATPVIAVERASQADERRVATTLDVLAEKTSELALKGPAVLLIGEVAGLAPAGDVEHVVQTVKNTPVGSAFSLALQEMSHA
ncbi:MAG: uroporphyrinogen-III C-methyltransferase [Pseudomonadota bacterium]